MRFNFNPKEIAYNVLFPNPVDRMTAQANTLANKQSFKSKKLKFAKCTEEDVGMEVCSLNSFGQLKTKTVPQEYVFFFDENENVTGRPAMDLATLYGICQSLSTKGRGRIVYDGSYVTVESMERRGKFSNWQSVKVNLKRENLNTPEDYFEAYRRRDLGYLEFKRNERAMLKKQAM